MDQLILGVGCGALALLCGLLGARGWLDRRRHRREAIRRRLS